ncbi:MAG: phosphotransferase [Eggerthellaceae bacterium]|nr:phosphotransferase [Eggerthellaceae bacterium]
MNQSEFDILVLLANSHENEKPTQRFIAQELGISLGAANKALTTLRDRGYVEDLFITEAGRAALEPYRVDNAIIMAAGLSSRFAPISYERPKGVLRVRDEVLIERQIRQLQEAGIRDITVVVGYKKEEFFYLEDKFGVRIVVNEEYASRNNNSTLHKVRDLLGNTYICSSDDYFTKNPFRPFEFAGYYASVYEEGETDEYCMIAKGWDKRIVEVHPEGGRDAWTMLGHVYWDRRFSEAFTALLDRIYDESDTAPKLWEDIYAEHIKELPPLVLRPYDKDIIWEFDSLDELREFDPDFIDNVNSSIMDNICQVLGCAKGDIRSIIPIKQGLTNLSFRFDVDGKTYVYRHPGAGTDEIINREAETFSQDVARRLGIDDTFIYEDAAEGWKLSAFITDCEPFDYHNDDHLRRSMEIARTLHQSGERSPWDFDVYQKAVEIVDMLGPQPFEDFNELGQMAAELYDDVMADGVEPCLCHNDFYEPNFLVRGDEMHLIDWEYSAMSDYASDLGTFVCCSDYDVDDALRAFAFYFGREPTPAEARHCLAYVGISAYYWFVWALYKDASGEPVGEWLYLWYRAAKKFGRVAVDLYREAALG